MLIEYNVTNFRSIRDEEGISMERYSEPRVDPDRVSSHGDLRLLKSVAVLGHNASGKSNLLESLMILKELVISSGRMQRPSAYVVPFGFTEDVRETVFDIRFLHGHEYRLTVAFLNGSVTREELLSDDALLYSRSERELRIGDSVPREDAEKIAFAHSLTNHFSMLISKCSESSIATMREPFEWFDECLRPCDIGGSSPIETALALDRETFMTILRNADTGISGISLVETVPALRDTAYGPDVPGGKMVRLVQRF